MKALTISGVLAVWALLATPSNSWGAGTENGGGQKAREFGELSNRAEITDSTTQRLPCCRLGRKTPCQFCLGLYSFSQLPIDPRLITEEEQIKPMDWEHPDGSAQRRTKRHLQDSPGNSAQLPCCSRKTTKNCRRCPGARTPLSAGYESFAGAYTVLSVGYDEAADDEMKPMNWDQPDESARRLTKRQLQDSEGNSARRLPCCTRKTTKNCRRCLGANTPLLRSYKGATYDEMTTMDWEHPDGSARRLVKRQLQDLQVISARRPPCCSWKTRKTRKNCRICPRAHRPLGGSYKGATYEEIKPMDWEHPDEIAQSRTKRHLQDSSSNSTKLPCCSWKIRKNCRHCPGANTPLKVGYDEAADDEMKPMDWEHPAGSARRVTKRHLQDSPRNSAPPCCSRRTRTNCRRCPGAHTPSKASYEGAAYDEMKPMDWEHPDGSARRLTKRNIQDSLGNSAPLPCCSTKIRKNCKRCPGANTPLKVGFEGAAYDETMISKDEDLTAQRHTRIKRSKMRCCQGFNKPPGCRHCPGSRWKHIFG